MKARLLFAAIAGLLCAITLRPAAAANPIKMQVESPLALVEKPLQIAVRSGRWVPLAITLTNTGDNVHGTLSAHLAGNSLDKTPNDYYTEVDLPNNSHKRVWLYVRMDNDQADGFEITFRGRYIDTLKAAVPLNVVDSSTRIIVTISDSGEKLSYLSGLKGSGLSYPAEQTTNPDNPYAGYAPPPSSSTQTNNTNPLRPIGASHELLPSRWIGFDATDMVVLKDFDHKALTPDQVSALRGYVASGGTVLVFGGADWQRLTTSPFADFWPQQVTSSTPAAQNETDVLISRFFHERHPNVTADAGDRLGGATILITRGALREGAENIVSADNTPLLTKYNYGAGRVLMLAVDPTQPPFLGWRGLDGLWATLISYAPRPRIPNDIGSNTSNPYARYNYGYGNYNQESNTPTDRLLGALSKSPELRTPPVSFIAWFLALYVFFLVPVNYSVLRYFDKRELAWVTVPVIVVAFSVMSYAAALSIKGRKVRTRQINIVQGAADAGMARADSMLWLFSPRKTAYQLGSDAPQMVVADYLKDRDNPVTIHEPEENTAFTVDDGAVLMWASRNFVAHGVVNVGNGIHVGEQGDQPVVQNKTPYDLRSAVLSVGGRLYPFGDIKAGGSGSPKGQGDGITRDDNQIVGRIIQLAHIDQLAPNETSYSDMASSALDIALSGHTSDRSSVFLVAWGNQLPAAIKAKDESPKEQNLSLYVFRCPGDWKLHKLAIGNQPDGTVAATVRTVSTDTLPATGNSASGKAPYYGYNGYAHADEPGQKIVYECSLPGDTQTAGQWGSLTLRVSGSGQVMQDINKSKNSYNTNYQPDPDKAPVTVQIWDESHSTWKTLSGHFNKGNNWSVQAEIEKGEAANYVRKSDNTVQVTVTTAAGNIANVALTLSAGLGK